MTDKIKSMFWRNNCVCDELKSTGLVETSSRRTKTTCVDAKSAKHISQFNRHGHGPADRYINVYEHFEKIYHTRFCSIDLILSYSNLFAFLATFNQRLWCHTPQGLCDIFIRLRKKTSNIINIIDIHQDMHVAIWQYNFACRHSVSAQRMIKTSAAAAGSIMGWILFIFGNNRVGVSAIGRHPQ